MKLSDKLNQEITRRWRLTRNISEKEELAKRYGYTLKQLDNLNKRTEIMTDWRLINETWLKSEGLIQYRVMPSYTGKTIGQIYNCQSAEVVFEDYYHNPHDAKHQLDQVNIDEL